jgi:hypothetical protein
MGGRRFARNGEKGKEKTRKGKEINEGTRDKIVQYLNY